MLQKREKPFQHWPNDVFVNCRIFGKDGKVQWFDSYGYEATCGGLSLSSSLTAAVCVPGN